MVIRRRSRMRRSRSVPFRSRRPIPAHYVRGQYDGYRDIDGVAAGSTTETYAALRLDIDNWRWSGVPFFIRTGKHLPVTQTELRLVFKHPPRLGFRHDRRPRPDANQLVVKLDPTTGVQIDPRRPPRGRRRGRRRSTSTWSSPRRAAKGRRRTRCCCTRRWWATARGSRARTASRRPGGSCSRCSTLRRRCSRTRPGSWGPAPADELVAGHGRWHGPWIDERHSSSAEYPAPEDAPAERRRAVAVPADRRVRVPLQLPHGRADRGRRSDRLAVRARPSTRRACSAACSTARPAFFRFAPFGINAPRRRAPTSRGRT